MIWFTSDTHFGHANIIRYCNRPFASVEEMNEALIQNWNAAVMPNDVVYHLGDVCFGSRRALEAIAPRLNGNKVLIKGNHDPLSNERYRALGFDPHKSLSLNHPELGRVFMIHRPPPEGMVVDFDLVLCGHVHSEWARRGKCINVGVDVWGLSPAGISSIWTLQKYGDHNVIP